MGSQGSHGWPEPVRTEKLASASSTIGKRTALCPLGPEPTLPRWLGVERCPTTEVALQDDG